MADWDFSRSIMVTQLLIELGRDYGLNLSNCLANTGIEPSCLGDAHAVVTAKQELALIRNLIHGIPVPALGIRAGERYHMTTFGIFGFVLTSSPCLRSVLQLSIRQMELTYAFCNMRLEDVADRIYLVLDDQSIPEDIRPFIVLRHATVLMTLQNELLGQTIPLKHIAFRLPTPADLTSYVKTFGVTPEFNAVMNYLEFDKDWLDIPLPQANLHTQQVCEAQCRELLAKRRVYERTTAQVRELLLQNITIMPDMEMIAKDLAMTSRTLRRKLNAEGTSFRILADEVREALAEKLLAIRGMRVEEVALHLGYSETSSFIYAFKRWKGKPPRGG